MNLEQSYYITDIVLHRCSLWEGREEGEYGVVEGQGSTTMTGIHICTLKCSTTVILVQYQCPSPLLAFIKHP